MGGRYQPILGWCAVSCSTLVACFWSFWGIIENFHEGWYHAALADNLLMMVGQYLLPMLIFMAAGVVAIFFPRTGGAVHLAAAILAVWHFRGASSMVVYLAIAGPLVLMSISYWLGRPQPRRWAVSVLVALPLVTMLICGAEPAFRVASRWDDRDLGIRMVQGNGVLLEWAPAGPGWPNHGVSWNDAVRTCRLLSDDGLRLADTPQDIWRLPTIDEVVRSSHRLGKLADGSWDSETGLATFRIRPDKESPLWDVHSKIIYWWTATEVDADRALRICYNGHVMVLPKKVAYGYLGFRAVKSPDQDLAAGQ
jgi:hypothetical protein